LSTSDDRIAGFLRLSLPGINVPDVGIDELRGAALIRELHVYGQSLAVGADNAGSAQHAGLGTRLLENADVLARSAGFASLAVISAIGTRQYYLDRGFERGDLYLTKRLAEGVGPWRRQEPQIPEGADPRGRLAGHPA